MNQTKTYRGQTIEELLPQIRAELGPQAVITRRREGVTGGIGGFFGRRCVEVEARSGLLDELPQTPALPARQAFDAYDTSGGRRSAGIDPELLRNPVLPQMVDQAGPFARELREAAERSQPPAIAEPEPIAEPEFEPMTEFLPVFAGTAGASPEEWQVVSSRLVELGLPEPAAESVVRDARRTMAPFDRGAEPVELVRRAIARQLRIEHGWRTKRRTVALVGAAGAGKTLTAARLCHAYATASPIAVRTLSLEPASAAYRLGSLTEHLDIGLRVADTPESAARAAARMPGESLIVVDTPAVSPSDPEGIAELASMLQAVKPDETHLLVPASTDARAIRGLFEAVNAAIPINRLLITRLDEVASAAVAVGASFALKRPLSYVTSGRRSVSGLRPADAAELAALVLP